MTPTLAPRLRCCAYRFHPRLVLDLRSGSRKSSTVPPPRPYKRKMVIHSPVKPATPQPVPGAVPPAVAAAAAATAADQEADLIGGLGEDRREDTLRHDFDAWDGDIPAGERVRVQVHASDGGEPSLLSLLHLPVRALSPFSVIDRDAPFWLTAARMSPFSPPPLRRRREGLRPDSSPPMGPLSRRTEKRRSLSLFPACV